MDSRRYFEIDLLKSISILTVVYAHSISVSLDPSNFLGYLASDSTRFAVPSLFFASAFLFDKKTESTVIVLKKRLVRILPPYIFCSLCFQLLNVPGLSVRLENLDPARFIYNLVLGNTFGVYYFVFVLLYLYLGSLILRRMPDSWAVGSWIGSAILLLTFVKGWVGSGISFFELLRHPFFHLFSYLSGWIFSLHYKTVSSLLRKNARAVICCAIILSAAILVYTRMKDEHFFHYPILTQIYIYVFIILLLTIGMQMTGIQKQSAYFSNFSYGIYLLHFPIIKACQGIYPQWPYQYSAKFAFIAWIMSIAGSFALIYVVRKFSKRFSIYLIGC